MIILLKAFASAVVGGFGSLPGAIVGGFTVGLFETACSFFISGSHKDAYAFLLMVVVLLIKPTGFFGVQGNLDASVLSGLRHGKVFNPYTEQLFSQMNFRNHSFNIKMLARNYREAQEIKNIIPKIPSNG